MCEGRPDICGNKVPDFKCLLDGYQKDGRDTAVTLNKKSVTSVPASTYDSASGSAMEIEYPRKSLSRFHKTLPDSPESCPTDDIDVSSSRNLETPSVLDTQYESTSTNIESFEQTETATVECSDESNSTLTDQIHQQTPCVRVIDSPNSQHLQVCLEEGDVLMKLEHNLHLTVKGFSNSETASKPMYYAGLEPETMAPEVAKFIMQKQQGSSEYQCKVTDDDITTKADVYSLARLVMELYPRSSRFLQRIFNNGCFSYSGLPNDTRKQLRLNIIKQIAQVDCMKLLVPDECSSFVRILLLMMLEHDHKARISPRQALQYMDTYDEKIRTQQANRSGTTIGRRVSDNAHIPALPSAGGVIRYTERAHHLSSKVTCIQTHRHSVQGAISNNSGNATLIMTKENTTLPVPSIVQDELKVNNPCDPFTIKSLKRMVSKRPRVALNYSGDDCQAELPRLDSLTSTEESIRRVKEIKDKTSASKGKKQCNQCKMNSLTTMVSKGPGVAGNYISDGCQAKLPRLDTLMPTEESNKGVKEIRDKTHALKVNQARQLSTMKSLMTKVSKRTQVSGNYSGDDCKAKLPRLDTLTSTEESIRGEQEIRDKTVNQPGHQARIKSSTTKVSKRLWAAENDSDDGCQAKLPRLDTLMSTDEKNGGVKEIRYNTNASSNRK